jgi:hypothetical protein
MEVKLPLSRKRQRRVGSDLIVTELDIEYSSSKQLDDGTDLSASQPALG